MNITGPAEIEARHVQALGPEFGVVFTHLVNETVWLSDKWREYRSLFMRSENRIALLNQAAGRFFASLDGMLWEDVLLHLCRLTDPTKVMGHKQLTIRRLPQYLAGVPIAGAVVKLVDEAVSRTEFARDWRNRRIGHHSLARAIDPHARDLAFASPELVTTALVAIGAPLIAVHRHFIDDGLSFDIPGGPGDADDLVAVLDDGLRAREARDERFRRREPLPEDLAPRLNSRGDR